MTLRADNHTIPAPGEARALELTTSTQHVNIATLFPSYQGQMVTLQANVPWAALNDNEAATTIDPTDITDLSDSGDTLEDDQTPPYPADTPIRVFIPDNRLWLHFLRTDSVSSGEPTPTLRIWVSSKIL